ncbi:MAG: metallophosphoesterase [Bacteroidales bacterium]|nr:metallophosphoesterase [Bacteroidales bacterium]
MRYTFILMLLLVLAAIVYIYYRVFTILPLPTWAKYSVVGLMVCAFASIFISYLFSNELSFSVVRFFYEVGNSWIFIMLYLFMIFIVLNILCLCHILPSSILHNNLTSTLSILGVMLVVFIYGNIHYKHKVRQPLVAKTEKKIDSPKKIVMISDLHIGYHNQRKDLAKWIGLIEKEEPDMVLIAGDIIDFSLRPIMQQEDYKEFKRIKVPIYACLGNHEYLANEKQAEEFYSLSGITLLRDSVAVNDNVVIIGRDDRSNSQRKTVKELTANIDTRKYIILLDHQPYHLKEAQMNNIDFQFSGHTHYGQMFPINLITDIIYEKAFGEYFKGKTQYYVSSGLGIWGAKFRVGTRSEYIVFTLQ